MTQKQGLFGLRCHMLCSLVMIGIGWLLGFVWYRLTDGFKLSRKDIDKLDDSVIQSQLYETYFEREGV